MDIPNWKRLLALQNDTLFILGMTESDPEKVRSFLHSYALDFDVALDPGGKVKESYRCNSVPQKILINPEGKVTFVETGGVSLGQKGKLEEQLEEMHARTD